MYQTVPVFVPAPASFVALENTTVELSVIKTRHVDERLPIRDRHLQDVYPRNRNLHECCLDPYRTHSRRLAPHEIVTAQRSNLDLSEIKGGTFCPYPNFPPRQVGI